MAQFLTSKNLISELKDLIRTAEKTLFIVSPYIKLEEEIKRILLQKNNDVDFEFFLVKMKMILQKVYQWMILIFLNNFRMYK